MATLTQSQIADQQLRLLALTDWEQFKALTGVDETKFIICMKKGEGKSVTQIAQSVKKSRSAVHRVCVKCP